MGASVMEVEGWGDGGMEGWRDGRGGVMCVSHLWRLFFVPETQLPLGRAGYHIVALPEHARDGVGGHRAVPEGYRE